MQIPVHRLIPAAVLFLFGTTAHALGLGNIGVQSALGQPLLASIGLLGTDSGELTNACIKVRVESLNGVSLASPQLTITRSGPSSSITLTSRQPIHEPVANIVVEAGCASPVRRSYQVLFDPPIFSVASPEFAPAGLSRADRDPVSAVAQNDFVKRKAVVPAASPARTQNKPASASAAKKSAASGLAATVKLANTTSSTSDVLRLSSDGNNDNVVSRLMLSSVLTLPTDATTQPLSEETRLAQRAFSAILRGEDPRASIGALRVQDATLRTQMAALQRQNSETQAALVALQTKSSMTNWLAGLLVLCLIAIGWLVLRLRAFTRQDKDSVAWWKAGQRDQEKQDAAQSTAGEFSATDLSRSSISIASAVPTEGIGSLPLHVYAGITQDSEMPRTQDTLVATAGLGLPEDAGSANQRQSANEFKVEEISDVTQEAEFWISLNNPKRAIEILEPYTEDIHPDSPVPWLYLLDLYREVGEQEKYNGLRERFTRLFNARIPLYGDPELASQTLEDFPHLLERICTLWSSGDIIPFLQSLLIDDREGARAGFDLPLYRDILLLLGIALEKKRLNQLEAPLIGIQDSDSQVGSQFLHPPTETIGEAALPSLDTGIDFEPIDFDIDIESDRYRSK